MGCVFGYTKGNQWIWNFEQNGGSSMEHKPLPVGVDNFELLITRGYYFIDKTWFMKELLDKKGSVNLFTRPRRFGKTLNMSMLQYFFEDMRTDDGEKKDNAYLFENMKIMDAGEKYLAHIGKYPVINLTLKDAKQPNFELAYAAIKRQIADEYFRHKYILQAECLSEKKEEYLNIMMCTANRGAYNNSIKLLSQCLEKYYGKKVIILIDEYDVPLENAFTENFYNEMICFIRSLFESSLKTNSSLEFAVITGCLRISKESIFTGLNNLKVISILDEKYAEYFGFTPEEVQELCDYYGLSHRYNTIQEWYNGYIFGDMNVYNPWSVIQFIDDLTENENWYPRSYWANTSSNAVVRRLLDMADDSVKSEIENLIDGGTIEKPIHEDITYGEVYENMGNLWNFMFFTGYFKKVKERVDEQTKKRYLTLEIPNEEVKYIFREKIMAWFDQKMKARDLTRLYTAFVNKDTQTLEEELTDILYETISSFDESENHYHGLVAGLLSGMKGYRTKSNRETGKGRCDLFVKPVSRRKEAFIVEFKKAKKIKELEAKAQEALQQIDDNRYALELADDGYDIASSYGISFCGKDCCVMHRERSE